MTVDLVKLKQLLAIARAGNFSRAAENLGITQPALSRNIALLEYRFGFKIFDRGANGVSLTPMGALAVADAEDLVRRAAVLEHNLHLYGRGQRGQISVGIGPQIAALLLPKLGVHMLETRPLLKMRCSLKAADVLMRELRDDDIEMMFCASNHIVPSSEIVIEPIGTMSYSILARSEHPLARDVVKVADLSAYPLAAETERHPLPHLTENGALICDNPYILREAVLKSNALWLAPPQIAASDLAAGRLIEINVEDLPFRSIEVGIVRLAGRASSPAATAITIFARNLLAEFLQTNIATDKK